MKKTQNLPYNLWGEYGDIIPEIQEQQVKRQSDIITPRVINSLTENPHQDENAVVARETDKVTGVQPRYSNTYEDVQSVYEGVKNFMDTLNRYKTYGKYGLGAAGIGASLYGLYKLYNFIKSKQQPTPSPAPAPVPVAPALSQKGKGRGVKKRRRK